MQVLPTGLWVISSLDLHACIYKLTICMCVAGQSVPQHQSSDKLLGLVTSFIAMFMDESLKEWVSDLCGKSDRWCLTFRGKSFQTQVGVFHPDDF